MAQNALMLLLYFTRFNQKMPLEWEFDRSFFCCPWKFIFILYAVMKSKLFIKGILILYLILKPKKMSTNNFSTFQLGKKITENDFKNSKA